MVLGLRSLRNRLAMTLEKTLLCVFIFLSFSFLNSSILFIWLKTFIHFPAQVFTQHRTYSVSFCFTPSRKVAVLAVDYSWSSTPPLEALPSYWFRGFSRIKHSAMARSRSQNRRVHYPRFEFHFFMGWVRISALLILYPVADDGLFA